MRALSDSALLGDNAWQEVERLSEGADYSVVGPRDNRIHEIETSQFPFSTICHLGRDFGDGRWQGCSGFLVASSTVVTAAHCLYRGADRQRPRRIRVVAGRRDRDTFPFGARFASRAYVPRAFVEATGARARNRAEHDYGVGLLDRPFASIMRFMPLRMMTDRQLDELRNRSLITIAGYPADRPVGTLWRHSERLKRIAPRRLFYSVDTCPGHSGSPIWATARGGRRAVIGVHTSGVLDERGRSYGCRPDTVLAPPGMMNGGIRLTHEVLASIRNPDSRIGGEQLMARML
jgi:V8-like Glu-specific endopeptidase